MADDGFGVGCVMGCLVPLTVFFIFFCGVFVGWMIWR